MLKFPIYLDYSATTPVDPRVAEKMIPYLTELFGNPASRSHSYGWTAEKAVEDAREEVAALVNADAKEIIWTSGATESNNLAIKGAAHFYSGKGKHIITLKTEHKAVLDTVRELERQGFEATYLDVQENGLLDVEVLKAAIRPDTVVVSVMFVNNEVGVIQPIAEIGELCREKGIIFHVDAAQATGKVAIDLATLKVDLMSFSAHKTYGPKGIGALYVRRKPRVRLEAQMHGGGHERGLRSGTLATHQIVGMGEAFRLARLEMAEENARVLALRDRLLAGYLTGDLTYVLFVKRFHHPGVTDDERQGQMAYLVGNGGLNWISWTTFSILGVVLANAIPAQWGLGFAGILALLGMLCSLASTKLRWISAAVAGTAAVAAFALPLKLNILTAIAASVIVCLLLEKRSLHPHPVVPPSDGGH